MLDNNMKSSQWMISYCKIYTGDTIWLYFDLIQTVYIFNFKELSKPASYPAKNNN